MPNVPETLLAEFKQPISLIPLTFNEKRPIRPWCKYQTTRADLEKVQKWYREYPHCNWGIVTGEISGIVVLDVDTDNFYVVNKYAARGHTPVVKTPRGFHIYYKHPGVRVGNRAWRDLKLDFRGDGGYVVAPGSHMNGKPWHWLLSPQDPGVELRDMPTNVRELLGI